MGLRILRRAGWDGRGMIELFEVLKREQEGTRPRWKCSSRVTPRRRIG